MTTGQPAPETSKTMQAMAIVLGFPTELDGKT